MLRLLFKDFGDTDLHGLPQISTNRLAAEPCPDIRSCLLARCLISPKAKQTFFLIPVHPCLSVS